MGAPVRIAINGFGRIGRCLLWAARRRDDVCVVGINARGGEAAAAHLLKYDSTRGVWGEEVAAEEGALRAGGERIAYFREGGNFGGLPWGDLGVDVVMECAGAFNDAAKAGAHVAAGAGRVLISAPATGADLTAVYGVNHERLAAAMRVVSNASCTTNCLAPVAKVLDDAFGIEAGLINTTHACTNDQRLLDGAHKDARRARAAMSSIIPTKTGAADAIGEVLPGLAGKLSGFAARVPTMNVSLLDLTCFLKREASAAEINDAFRAAAGERLAGVLAVCDLPLVSSDFNMRPESAIVDSALTKTAGGRLAKVLAWYDNEWAFSCRMLDVAVAWMRKVGG